MGLGHGSSLSWWNLTGGTDSLRTYIATNKVVQSGLVLNLDAGASTSYPGSGTSWTDLSDKISSATGGLPIYNTTDNIGAVKGTGTRTDANASSLVLAIPMDGANNGTTFTDESANIKGSGSAKTITRNGDSKTLTAQSKFYGSSGYFDGSGDYLNLGNNSDFGFGTGDFSIEFWLNYTGGNGYVCFFQTGNNGTNTYIYYGLENGTKTPFVWSNYNVLVGNTSISNNTWQHHAVVRSNGVINIYLNGTSIGSASWSSSLSTNNTAFVGSNDIGTQNTTGYIQDLRIYKGVAKYTANFTPPGNPNNGTLTNGPTYSSANGGSIVFDGVDDYVTLSNTSNLRPGTGDFTIEAWIYKSGANGGSFPSTATIYGTSWSGPSPTGSWILFTTESSGTKVALGIWDSIIVTSTSSLLTNQWYHIAVSRIGTTVSLYINNVLESTATSSANANNSVYPIYVGLYTDPFGFFGYFNGRIPVVRLYNGKGLTAAEVSQNYNALRARYGV